MTLRRPCLGVAGQPCPQTVTPPVFRCDHHQAIVERITDHRRDTTANRGYDAAWQRASRQTLRRHRFRCQLQLPGCTGRADTVDHITPLANGGQRLDPDNLQAACRHCNSTKGNRP